MNRIILVAVTYAALSPSAACGQGYPFSQRATVSQNVAFTHLAIEYGRPVARGRTLFGQLVPWDSIWHPGADSATRIVIDHDVLVEQQPLAAGEYSLWLIPRAQGNWTVIFNRAAHVFHRPYPGRDTDALRVDVAPEQLSHMETFAFYFPVVNREEAALRLHWGTTGVTVRLRAPYRPPDAGSSPAPR